MPIAEFGKAMLRGMGWNEGKAIGKTNKGLANVHILCTNYDSVVCGWCCRVNLQSLTYECVHNVMLR